MSVTEKNKARLLERLEGFKTLVEAMDADCFKDFRLKMAWKADGADQYESITSYKGTGTGSPVDPLPEI